MPCISTYLLYAKSDALFIKIMVASQIITFSFGLHSQFEQIGYFKREGLIAMIAPMKRRISESFVFLCSMTLMLGAYLIAMPLTSTTSEPDLFLLFALAPGAILFIQVYWMMGAYSRFREKMVPQLDYVDYLVMKQDLQPEITAAFLSE